MQRIHAETPNVNKKKKPADAIIFFFYWQEVARRNMQGSHCGPLRPFPASILETHFLSISRQPKIFKLIDNHELN